MKFFSDVVRALRRARSMALSMARGGGGNRIYDANLVVLARSHDRFTSIQTKEGVESQSESLSGEGSAIPHNSCCESRSCTVWNSSKQRPRHKNTPHCLQSVGTSIHLQ